MNYKQQLRQKQAVLELEADKIMKSEINWRDKYFELGKLVVKDKALEEAVIILDKIEGEIYE